MSSNFVEEGANNFTKKLAQNNGCPRPRGLRVLGMIKNQKPPPSCHNLRKFTSNCLFRNSFKREINENNIQSLHG